MTPETKEYVEPTIEKRDRLEDVTEATRVMTGVSDGGPLIT